MAGKGDIDIGINVKDAGVAAAVDAIFNGAEGAVNDFNKLLGIDVQKKLVVETFFDPSTAQKGIRVVERDVNNLGSQIEKLAEKSKKLEFGSATSLKGQLREATQARDQIKRYEESVGVLGQRVLTVNQAWAVQNARVQELSRQLSIASANGFWAKVKAGFNLQGLSNFSNGLVAVTQGLQSASILIGQVIGSFNQLFTALAKIQQFELSFKAIGASAGETSLAFQESERIALGLGVGIQTVRDAFQQLSPVILASGGSIGDVSAITESLSSRFAAFGLSADKARRVTNGIIQAFGKGKLQAEELTQQISEADPAFRIDLASAIGVSVAELGELVKAGEITSDRLIEILPLLSKSSLLFGKLGDSGASAANALAKGEITITQARTQLENLNQLSFEQLARAFEPFLTALIRVQAAFVDFGTAISNATALKVFGEFLGQLTSQAGGVIDVIGKIALTFLSIIEAVGNVINAIDNFTESIGGIRVVVTGLAALITTKLVVSLLRLGVTLGTTIVTSIAQFGASIAAGGAGITGLAASIGKGIASIFGLDSASLKLIATNFKTVASTGGVTASLKGLAVGARTAAASILGAGSANAAPWLADIAKQATNGAQEISKLAPATQLVIPGLTATGEAAKAGETGLKALGSATQLPIPGLNATNEAVKAYTKGTLQAFLQSQQGAAGITQVANAAKDGVPAFIPYTAAIQGAGGAAAGLGPAAVAGAAGVGAAGTAAGAATAPTLTFAGAVSAANASLTAGIKAALAFGAALLTNPITATIIGISALAAGVFFLNKAFSGSEASIKSFDEGIKGIKERSEKAIAAIDAAGDSAGDFEERINNLDVTPDGLSETAEIFDTFPALVRSATGEFKKIEKEATGFFEKAEKAVAKYNKEQDKTGKGALKVAQIISDSENAVQLALETTKRKRAELEDAATKSGGPIREENKKLLIGYNENIKALERKKQAIEDLKATAVASGIEIPVTTVDRTKSTLDGIKSRIETLKSNIVLELDPRKLDAASSKLEFLKFELEFLEKDRYQLQIELEYKINEAGLQAQLDITDAQKANIEAQLGLQQALLSVDEARLTAQEKALSDQIERLKKAGASSQQIYDLELKLKNLANEKLELKRRAVQAELDALPKIQEAERKSLELQQKLKQIEIDKSQAALKRLENEAKIAQLQSRGDLAKELEKTKKDDAKIKLLTDEINLRQEIIDNIGEEKKALEIASSAQADLNQLANENLRLKQETDRANLNSKAIEAGVSVNARGAAPASVKVPVEFIPPDENDLERQIRELSGRQTIEFEFTPNTDEVEDETSRLENQGLEINASVTRPETSELQKELDELQKGGLRIETSLGELNTNETYATIGNLESQEIEIYSNIKPPDPTAVTSTVQELNNENVEIGAGFEVSGTEGVFEKIGELEGVDVKIQSGINPLDTDVVFDRIDELQGVKIQIPSNIENPNTSSIDRIREDNEGTPIEIPVNVGTVQGADGVTNLDGGLLEITPVIGELDTTEVEGQLEELSNLVPAITPLVEAPDTSETRAVLQDLKSTNVQFKTTVAPLPTEATRAQAAALATTPVQLKSSIASLPTEPTKAEAAALASTPIRFNPTIAPVPVEEARAELLELGNTQVVITPVVNPPDTTIAKTELASLSAPVNVPLTVNADTVQAKTALTEVRTEGEAIQSAIENATAETTSLGEKAQDALLPFDALGRESVNLLDSTKKIDQNFADIGSAATAAVQPINSLNNSLTDASENASAVVTATGDISTNASGAVGAFDELLIQITGILDNAINAAKSTDLLKTGFDDVNTAATNADESTTSISDNLRETRQNTSESAVSSVTLATAFGESASSSATLSTNTANVATEASRVVTQTDAMYVDIRDSVGVTDALIGRLNTAARAAASIRIPSSNGRFAGGPVQGGAAYTVNEFGKEMFLSNSGRLSQINAPAWGTWRAPSSGTIIPAHIASGIDIPKGGVKVSKPSGSLSSSSVKKNGSGLGRVITNLVNALNASRASQKNNDNAIQATQAIQIGKLTQAVNKLVDKDWNVGVNIQGQNGGLSYARAINRKI